MGIRSDVGVALRSELRDEVLGKFKGLFDEAGRHDNDEGTLFVFRDIKWYTVENDLIAALYKMLAEHDSEDYFIVEACGEYPETDENDIGSWSDNPWGLHKYKTVTIEFEE